MELVYRGYRIAITEADHFTARITHVRGTVAPFFASALNNEGAETCACRARELIDKYIRFLGPGDPPTR